MYLGVKIVIAALGNHKAPMIGATHAARSSVTRQKANLMREIRMHANHRSRILFLHENVTT